jgi:hypothetical protein
MFRVAGMILGCQLIAPLMALDPPKFHGLGVASSKRYPREVTQHYYDWAHLREPEELPERLIIRGASKSGGRFHIGIDLEQHIIAHADWNVLHADEYMGSAAIGVAIFGLPGLIVTSPIWLTAHALYKLQKLFTGMDHHNLVMYLKLARKLSRADRKALRKALQNHHNGVEDAWQERRRAEYDAKIRAERIAMLFENRKDDICEGPFMVRFAAGCAEPEEVMQDMADWHHRVGADQHVKLHEWLGMTMVEFEDWSAQRKTIFQLLEDREWAPRVQTDSPT